MGGSCRTQPLAGTSEARCATVVGRRKAEILAAFPARTSTGHSTSVASLATTTSNSSPPTPTQDHHPRTDSRSLIRIKLDCVSWPMTRSARGNA